MLEMSIGTIFFTSEVFVKTLTILVVLSEPFRTALDKLFISFLVT